MHYLSLQSENSAFDRVPSKAASSARQPIRGSVPAADPVRAVKLVTTETPESASECSWVESAAQDARMSTLKVLEDERGDTPVLQIRELKTEDPEAENRRPLPEAPEKSGQTHLTMEDGGLVRDEEETSGNEDLDRPAVGAVTVERQKELESVSSPPPAQQQPAERMGRSKTVLYVQSEPVAQDARSTGPKKEGPTRMRKVLTRSLSDYTGPPRLLALKAKDPASKRELELQSAQAEGGPCTEVGVLDTKVSVAQLRNAFLESVSASKKAQL